MKFKELSNKDRYRIIRMGVQNGIHSVSDIEHIFDEGGDLNDDEQKQLEWSKNWHTQRVNYMPWTDEQKAAYLKAIDNTYSDNKFTRDTKKPMGFTPKDKNININYENAENTTYGNMAKGSGLVHELAHKLSYNANNELNAIDSSVPTKEEALLRTQKLSRLMHPLEVGGIQNTNNFVDYNAKSEVTREQEKRFRKNGVYQSRNVENDPYGHNAIEVKAKLDELRYRLNLRPDQMDIKPESVGLWRGRGIFPSSLDDYSDEQIAKMLNTFAYNNTNVPANNLLKKGGHLYAGDEENTQEINKAIPREILKEEEQYVKNHTKYNNFNNNENSTRWAVTNATNRATDFYNQDVKKRDNIYNNDYGKQALDNINYNMKNIKLVTMLGNRSYYDPLTNEIALSKEGNVYSPHIGAQSSFLKDIFIPYDFITPTIVHERTHEQQRKISPILSNLKLSFGSISEHDRNILNKAYKTKPITELKTPFSSSMVHEKHATNRESRYNLWNELSIQLGRNPSIKELNEYIKSMPFEELKKRLGGYRYDYDLLDEDAIKKALIEVAENKSNKNKNINYT